MRKANRDIIGKKFSRLLVTETFVPNKGWLCLCDCGNTAHVRSYSLKRGQTKSCGCIKDIAYSPEDLIRLGVAAYKSHCCQGKRKCFLTEEEIKTLIFSNCHYCKSPPLKPLFVENQAHGIRILAFLSNGIDRIDSNLEYTSTNVFPCCETCNKAKSNLTKEEFYLWLTKLSKNFPKNWQEKFLVN